MRQTWKIHKIQNWAERTCQSMRFGQPSLLLFQADRFVLSVFLGRLVTVLATGQGIAHIVKASQKFYLKKLDYSAQQNNKHNL